MSDYGSVEDIRCKICEGIYTTVTKDSARNELWKFFVCVAATLDGEVTKIPYVSCIRCNTVLTYNSKTGGTSHLRRHVDCYLLPVKIWWRVNSPSLPRLSTLAKEILSIPASSAASERSFSVAGSTVSQRRTALDSDNLEDILFVHSNCNA